MSSDRDGKPVTKFTNQGLPENFSLDNDEVEKEPLVESEQNSTVVPNTSESFESQQCLDTNNSRQDKDENNQNSTNTEEETVGVEKDLESELLKTIKLNEYHENDSLDQTDDSVQPNDTDQTDDTDQSNDTHQPDDTDQPNDPDRANDTVQQAKRSHNIDNVSLDNVNHFPVFDNIPQSDSQIQDLSNTGEFKDHCHAEGESPSTPEAVFGTEQETMNGPVSVTEYFTQTDKISADLTTIPQSDLHCNTDHAQERQGNVEISSDEDKPNEKQVVWSRTKITCVLLFVFMCLFGWQVFSKQQYPKSAEDLSLTNVKRFYNTSHSDEVCVYAFGFSGAPYIPPDIPPDEPPNLPWPNLIESENQQVNMAEQVPVPRPGRQVAGRNISQADVSNGVSQEPRMHELTFRHSSAGDDVAADTSNNYISLRDNQLSISVRQEINHSTMPLPPTLHLETAYSRDFNVSENNTNLPSTVPLPPMTANYSHSTVSENNTYLPSSGTCCNRRANDELEKLPCGEIQSGWISADGDRTSIQAVPRESENPRSSLGSHHLNMTQSSTPLPDVPLGMSNQTARADTFRDGWPHSYLPQMMMASAGLYYTGVRDVARCFYCGNCLDSWKPGDDPLEEHAKAYPDCYFNILCLRNRNENHSRAQNGAVGEQDGLMVQSEELIPNDTGGTNRGINSGSETAWGGSETAVNNFEPPEVHAADDIQHLNDDTEEVVCVEESADPRQQGRDGVCNTNGTPSLTTAARRRAGSQLRQSSADNEAAQRNPVQQHRTGILSAVMSQRRRVINQPEQHRLIGENNRERIDNFLRSGDGRRLLDEGFLRTDVAYAVERVLQENHPLIYMMVLEALILSRRRRCKKKRANTCQLTNEEEKD